MKTLFRMIGKYSLLILVFHFVLCLYSFAAGSSDSLAEVTAVRSECGDSIAGLNDRIIVSISHLNTLQKSLAGKPLILFINGVPLQDARALPWDTLHGGVQFFLKRTDTTKTVWNALLGMPKGFTKDITISTGPKDGAPLPCRTGNLTLIVIRKWQFWLFILLFIIYVLIIVHLYRKSDLLRDYPEYMSPPGKKSFSLSRSQMLFWTSLALVAYVFIWLTTGDMNSVTDSVLILMGISSATALGGQMVTSNTPGMTSAAVISSGSYWKDIVYGSNDVDIHRFQIVAWTILLGIVFIYSVYAELSMPTFSITLLTLMGISSGTYLGIKMKEKNYKEG
jgi:hypothetical protein